MKSPNHLNKLKLVFAKKHLWKLLPVFASLVLVITVVVLNDKKEASPNPAEVEAYQNYLQSQVDTETGAPRDGRDPATQPQSSLASAASSPFGAGQSVDKPASDVNGGNGGNPAPTNDASKTGLNSAGCYYEYGDGSQCVPAHAATNGKLTCEGVTTHGGFHDGVSYSNDRFKLDKNSNGIACDSGDF